MAAGRGGGARGRVTGRARRRRGRGALRGGHRRRRVPPASRSSRSSPASSASAPTAGARWSSSSSTRTQQGLLVLADAKRGDIDVSAAAYAQALAGETPDALRHRRRPRRRRLHGQPVHGRRLAALAARARARASSCSCARRTRARPTSRTCATEGGERVWERVARLVDGLGAPGPASGLHDVGAVVGATAPEHLARARELMPRTPFLLPGVGAQGGRVEDLAPGLRGRPRRRPRHRLALDRRRPRAPRRRAGAGRPPRGRAPARAGLVAWVIGPRAPRPMLRSAHGQSSTSQHRPLAGPGGPDHLRGGRVRRRRQHAAQGRHRVDGQRPARSRRRRRRRRRARPRRSASAAAPTS